MRKEQLRKLLIENEFDELFQLLYSVKKKVGKKNWNREVTIIHSGYEQLKSDNLTGVINISDSHLQFAQLRNSLLQIIESIPDEIELKENQEINLENVQTQTAPAKKARKNYVIIWTIMGIFGLIYSLLPSDEIELNKLSITCEKKGIDFSLKNPWSQGNLALDEIWVKKAIIKDESSNPQTENYYKSFEAKGDITLEKFYIEEDNELEIGTEGNSLTLEANRINGRIVINKNAKVTFISPKSDKPPFEQMVDSTIVRNEPKWFSFKHSQKENTTSTIIRLQYKDKNIEFDEPLLISEIIFYTSIDGRLESLIKKGGIQVVGIEKNRFENLSQADLVKVFSSDGLRMKVTQNVDEITFTSISKSSIKLFIGNNQIKPLRIKVWFYKNYSLTIISLLFWALIFVYLIFQSLTLKK